ncbi:MAG: catalase family protein [Janthinobacterium lividum]
MSSSFVPYSDSVEVVSEDETETIDKILESMHRLSDRTQKKEGHAIRVSHAKSHGFAVGELAVLDDLPGSLRQGLFAKPSRYSVIVRLANVPGEITSDAVSTQRGLAFKILGVEGEMLPGHTGESTQDFVLDTGSRFGPANVKEFLATHLGLEHAPQVPEVVKETVSKVSFAANKALHTVGGDSGRLDVYGHPRIHPLTEAYFTQAPIRYGDYIAKLAVVPVSPAQLALETEVLDTAKDENALRTATVQYLRGQDAVFEVRVQLCTDLETMPVENANTEWSEEESPYQAVARLTLPRQEAYSEARKAYGDGDLSFCPSHSLAAFRPLGSIMRARLRAYPEMSRHRRTTNGRPLTEPQSIDQVPV